MKSRSWVVSTLIMIIICFLLFSYFYYYERARIIGEMEQNQKNQARLTAKIFEELMGKWNSELFYLTRQSNIILMNKDGKSDLTKLQSILKNEINSITRTDKNGIIIYTAPFFPNSIGQNISAQRHMKKILTDHMPVGSDVFQTVQGFLAVAIHYPVYKNGEYDGSLAFVINFKKISQTILSEIKIGRTGYAWMLSSDGVILSSPDSNNIGKSILKIAVDFPELANLANEMMSAKEGTAFYIDGKMGNETKTVKRIAYYIPVKFNNTFWSIAVSCSEDEVVSSIYGYTEKLALIFLIILFGGIFFSYLGLKAWAIVKESDERRKIENELKESEKRYRLISSIASDYMFSEKIDEDGNPYLEWVGGSFEKITGYTKDEYNTIGGWRTVLYHEDYFQDEKDIALLKNNQHVITDVRIIQKNGKITWVKVYAYPMWDDKKQILAGIYGGVQDIDKIKRAEEALRKSEEKFSKAFYSSPDSISISKIESGEIIEVNDGFERIFGYTKQECIGKLVLDLDIYPNSSDRHALIEKTKKGDALAGIEIELMNKWGEVKICNVYYNLIEFFGELCIVSTVKDLTKLKKAEKSLKENEEKFRIAFDNAPSGMCMIKPDGQFLEVNPMLCRMFGYSREELLSGTIYKITHPEDAEKSDRWIRKMISSDISEPELEKRYIHKDGHIVWGMVRAQWIRNTDGIAQMSIAHIMDITERKQVEIALQETEYFLNRSQKVAQIGSYKMDVASGNWISSPSLDLIFGIDDKFPRTVNSWLELILNDDRELCTNHLLVEVLKKHSRFNLEYRIKRHNDEQVRWVQGLGELEYDNNGNPTRMIGTIQDVTERKHDREVLQKTNRQLRMLSDCNQALIRSNDENELLTAVCRIVVEIGGYSMAWVGYAENDEEKTVKTIAQYGFKYNYLESKKVTWSDSEPDGGPVGTAIRTGMPSYIQDVRNNESFKPWRDQAVKCGYESVSAFPLKIGTKTFGSLNIYSTTVNSFDDFEINMLNELSEDLAFGIATLRTRTERERIADSLRHSENFLNTIIEHSPHSMWISDDKGTLIKLNEACRKLLHIKDEEVVGIYNVFNDDVVIQQGALPLVQSVFEKGENVTFELRYESSTLQHLKLSETTYAVLIINISPVINANGKVTNAIIQHMDITEREMAENELRRLSRQNEEALKMAHMGQWEYDVASRNFIFNDDYYKLFGLTVEQAGGYVVNAEKFSLKYTDLKYFNIVKESFFKAIQSNDPNFQYQTELVIYKGNGEPRDVNGWFRIEKDIHGNTIKLYGVNQDITERKKAESLISASLREKEVLLKEIYHRTKNNMWVISSILGLQAETLENKEARNILKETVNRIYAMALVHQKLYQSQNLSKIDLKSYIGELVKLLISSYEISNDKIILKMKLESVNVLIDSAIPLGLVINELITNSFKYAFPGDKKGKIEVSLSKSEQGEIRFDINDNGVGIPDENIFSKSKSLGLKMILEIVERQLNGKVKFESKHGVHCSITFYDTLYTERV